MHISFKTIILLSAIMLAACQTTGQTTNVDPQEAELARSLISESCAVTKTKGSNETSRQAEAQQIAVMSIRDRHDGWRAIDAAMQGFRDNIYFNRKAGQVICGGKNWHTFTSTAGAYTPSTSKILQALPEYQARGFERSIAVSWEGRPELFAGTIREVGTGETGTVAIVLPNNEGNCSGGYTATGRTTGHWTIDCTNGLNAKGTYTAFGDGKGASGIGVDNQGRKVTYTIGGRF